MKKLILTMMICLPLTAFSQSEFQQDLAAMIKMNSQKVVALAEAIPAEDYAWSPSEGVRDVRQVVLHIAGGNYFFPTFADISAPDGVNPMGLEANIKTKEAAIEALKASYDHMLKSIGMISDEKLKERKDFFGNEMSVRMLLMAAFGHCEEHMGQLIAYARANEITPPWSQAE